MNTKKVVISVGVVLIAAEIFWLSGIATSGKAPVPAGCEPPRLRHLEVVEIRDGRPKIEIPITGCLRSYKKIDVYAEVSGKVLRTSKPFKEGLSYRKGEVLIRISTVKKWF